MDFFMWGETTAFFSWHFDFFEVRFVGILLLLSLLSAIFRFWFSHEKVVRSIWSTTSEVSNPSLGCWSSDATAVLLLLELMSFFIALWLNDDTGQEAVVIEKSTFFFLISSRIVIFSVSNAIFCFRWTNNNKMMIETTPVEEVTQTLVEVRSVHSITRETVKQIESQQTTDEQDSRVRILVVNEAKETMMMVI